MAARKLARSSRAFPGNSFLRHLEEDELEQLFGQCQRRSFTRGQHIVRFNDADTNLYVLESGRVRVTLFSPDGKEVNFIDLNAGENFGEFAAIDSKPRSANVIALTKTRILIIPADVFMALITQHPTICQHVLQQLTAVVRRLCERIFEYSTLDVGKRVRLELLRLAWENLDYDGIARIPRPLQTDLASRLSCNREAISREFSNLEQVGILRRSRGKLVIDDINRLKSMVAGHEPG